MKRGKKSLEQWCIENDSDLLEKWDYELNQELLPSMVSYGSKEPFWCKDELGHHWKSDAYALRRGRGCPYCSGNKVLPGFNDLGTKDPEIASDWHPTKNGDLRPSDFTYGSKKKVWWLGKCGHEWEAQINNRCRERGCPVCMGRLVVKGFNDLVTVRPDIASDWHPFKNEGSTPDQFTEHSNKVVWWLGKCGHEWKTDIESRSYGSGCPVCKIENSVSFNEKAIAYYLGRITAVEETAHPMKSSRKEIDIFLPDLRIAIEYDGEAFHRDVEKDMRKNRECSENGIRLIRVREPNCPPIDGCECIHMTSRREDDVESMLTEVVGLVASVSNRPVPNIDIQRDRTEIYGMFVNNKKERSLAELSPAVASQWHPTKNGAVTPEYVAANSQKRFWWRCENGHEWESTVANRYRGSGCPVCSGAMVVPGINDAFTKIPELEEWWHPTKNEGMDPSSMARCSHTKVWWICKKGHEFQSTFHEMSGRLSCPYCTNRKVLAGFNDLATTNPELLESWDYDLNGDKLPTQYTRGSSTKVWWKCEKGHSYDTTIHSKNSGQVCPYCSGARILPGFNDLSTTHPELASFWDHEHNGDLEPTMVSKGSQRRVWWKCEKGHHWGARICNRVNPTCPVCKGWIKDTPEPSLVG